VGGFGLGERAGVAVEDIAAFGVGLDDPGLGDGDHQIVGD
jgi:hypothetical protein